jgi:hypothetical protein
MRGPARKKKGTAGLSAYCGEGSSGAPLEHQKLNCQEREVTTAAQDLWERAGKFTKSGTQKRC